MKIFYTKAEQWFPLLNHGFAVPEQEALGKEFVQFGVTTLSSLLQEHEWEECQHLAMLQCKKNQFAHHE